MFDLTHKVIAVAGGAGYLGTAIIEGLLRQGAHVLCMSSKKSSINHSSLICEIVDCVNAGEVAATLCTYPGIDGLVNVAGRAMRGKNQRPDDFVYTLKQALAVQYTCSRVAAPYLWKGSSIVNMGSMWGCRAPDFPLYLDLQNEPSPGVAAAYGGVHALTRYMAASLAPRVRVNSVVPGWFPKPSGTPREDYIAGIVKNIPLDRIGKPADVVGAVVFLLSDEASYITGQEIVVDGGYTIK